MDLKEKKVIVFDLDGTLAESKQSLDVEMSGLLYSLMQKHVVGIMSGGSIEQYRKQFLPYLRDGSKLFNLVLIPTSGASMYIYRDGEWFMKYEEKISEEEFHKIKSVIESALQKVNLTPEEYFGEIIEYRGTQVSYSGLGQNAPIEKKSLWDPNQEKRREIISLIKDELKGFEIRIGGTTSIDINKKGVDKAYGVKELSKVLDIPIKDMVYVGDALYEGGNDEAVKKSKIDTVEVKNVEETKELIKQIIA